MTTSLCLLHSSNWYTLFVYFLFVWFSLLIPYMTVKMFSGGDEGTRTPDLCLAKAPLSQLSYIPTTGMCGSEKT
jgi:hypothetical protein